jgi:hypothetical protein
MRSLPVIAAIALLGSAAILSPAQANQITIGFSEAPVRQPSRSLADRVGSTALVALPRGARIFTYPSARLDRLCCQSRPWTPPP